MKKYIVILMFLLFSFCLTACSIKEPELNDLDTILKRGYIIIGVKSDSPPFGYYKDNKRAGYDIELSRKIASYIFEDDSPEKIKFVNVTPQNRISKLNAGEVDILVATMSINDKRRLVINFSKPYYITSQKIMVKKDSKLNNLSQFTPNNRLAVIMGTTGEKIARLTAVNTTFVGAKTYIEAFNYLQNSQVDAILGDEAILASLCNSDYKIINRAYSREFYAVAVRKQEKSKELLNKINYAVSGYLDENKLNLKGLK